MKSKLTQGDPKVRYARRKPLFMWVGILAVATLAVFPTLYIQSKTILKMAPELYSGSPLSFSISSMIQPFLLGVGALVAGHILAHRLNLKSILYDVKLKPLTKEQKPAWLALQKTILMQAITAGIVVAVVTVGFDAIFQSQLPEILQKASNTLTPENILSMVIYQGITEEILLRWGLMTISIYIFSSQGENQQDWVFIAGIIFATILYLLTRYRSFSVMTSSLTPLLGARLAIQSIGGIAFGILYWKHHLEAAIVGHITCQVMTVILTAILL
ncbi:CPBP family glutamic-type intramembrane protease [Allofustis seminis]|uniref:CPBP family glutamic-type intramembrane protease n=1 Tax=Allofustis seminis TaxID=166939 RepID=UPI00036AD300|nr:CPBP family glutamic-type intramembrane protease [Allofustis seminis]